MKSLYPRIALAYASVLLCLVSRAFGAPAAESIALLQSSSVENGSIGFDTDDDLHYWQRRKDGWFWYMDPTPEPKPTKEKQKVPAPTEAKKKPDVKPVELKKFEEQKQHLEDLKIIAIMSPTDANLVNYMQAQQAMMNQASVFSDKWRRVLWQTPTLDYAVSGGRPTNNFALDVYDKQARAERVNAVAELGKSHGLFFFFRGNCPYCHKYAPTLKRFEQLYGIKVFAISLDGGTLPEYPNPKMDNGMATMLDVKYVPATFLAVPGSKQITPIGYGVLADTDLLDRIHTLTQTKPGEQY